MTHTHTCDRSELVPGCSEHIAYACLGRRSSCYISGKQKTSELVTIRLFESIVSIQLNCTAAAPASSGPVYIQPGLRHSLFWIPSLVDLKAKASCKFLQPSPEA